MKDSGRYNELQFVKMLLRNRSIFLAAFEKEHALLSFQKTRKIWLFCAYFFNGVCVSNIGILSLDKKRKFTQRMARRKLQLLCVSFLSLSKFFSQKGPNLTNKCLKQLQLCKSVFGKSPTIEDKTHDLTWRETTKRGVIKRFLVVLCQIIFLQSDCQIWTFSSAIFGWCQFCTG